MNTDVIDLTGTMSSISSIPSILNPLSNIPPTTFKKTELRKYQIYLLSN